MNLSQNQKLWGKRLLLLAVVSLLIMTIAGQIDMSHPFKEKVSCLNRYIPTIGERRQACYESDIGQVITFILHIAAGTLIWHFVDEKKK